MAGGKKAGHFAATDRFCGQVKRAEEAHAKARRRQVFGGHLHDLLVFWWKVTGRKGGDSGCWSLDARCGETLDAGFSMLDVARFWMLDARCGETLDAGFSMLDAGMELLTGFPSARSSERALSSHGHALSAEFSGFGCR